MNALKWITNSLTVLAGLTGLLAAYYWYRTSKVPTVPGGFEPVEVDDKTMWLMGGLVEAGTASAALNKRTAILTAVSVSLSALSSLLGALA